jgi:hypothetical protein
VGPSGIAEIGTYLRIRIIQRNDESPQFRMAVHTYARALHLQRSTGLIGARLAGIPEARFKNGLFEMSECPTSALRSEQIVLAPS